MIVALSTLHGEPEKCGADGVDLVGDGRNTILLRDGSALVSVHAIAQETSGHLLLHASLRHQIPCYLLTDELVIRHVVFESLNHPVPPCPHLTVVIHRVAIGVCVTRHVQPVEREPLSKGVTAQ